MKFIQRAHVSQPLLIVILVSITAIICTWIGFSSKTAQPDEVLSDENETGTEENHAEDQASGHAEEGLIQLTPQQLSEQGLKVETVETGMVDQVTLLPGKLMVNTDQQAHVSPNFSGHVEQVNVALGQTVKKGQTLAVLSVPELIDLQASLSIAESTLNLAGQDQRREQQLWSQGISAKQDYQRAENAYQQAKINVSAIRARLNSLGADQGQSGRFKVIAPISGVISQKDIVMGENVQLADQLFVIEQLKALWLEFNLPSQFSTQLQAQQKIQFQVNGSDQRYEATIQSLNSQADLQTGRLVVRAKLDSQAPDLRPNVMVNVLMAESASKNALRVRATARQMLEGKASVFVVESQKNGKVQLKPQVVELGQASQDGQWVEVISGLSSGQRYISQGSVLLKSELEKNEAAHEH